MTNNNNFLIIDGSSLLSTSYYGNLPKEVMYAKTDEDREAAYKKILQTSTGIYTNGIYGFFKTLNKIIDNQKPKYLAVVFDVSRQTTFRKKMYDDYKGTRKATPAPLGEQFKLTQDVLEYIGIPVLKSPEYEADDYAGSLAKKFETEVPCLFYTKDEDYLQLISENSRVWLVTSKAGDMYNELGLTDYKSFNIPDGTFEYTLTTFEHFKGLEHPSYFIDAKGLLGDKSDNIPGCPGIGEKSAIPLLQEYKTIENLYETLEAELEAGNEKELSKFFKESLGISRSPIKNLVNGKESALLSKELATIKTDIEEVQSMKLDDFVLNINKERYIEKMNELEMKSLLPK